VLDQVVGPDPEDPDTAQAASHVKGSFANLDPASLKGTRIGFLRQRFSGFTGEREIPIMMDRVKHELSEAGATVIDVSIPDLDSLVSKARGTIPCSTSRLHMNRLRIIAAHQRR
jgi:Asp-tRNA(Asn)/Glu-tRNA(Gln) amidotransferase A subunit family amidase